MQIITLEVPDPEIAEMIIGLAKRLNCNILSNPMNLKTNSEEIIDIMKRISERGSLSAQIPDPILWQKEIRKDRALPGRDE